MLVERWIAAWVQDRRGPNRVGIPLTKIRLFGLGQPLADGLKIILKEDFTPSHVDKVLYNAAPLVLLTASLAIFAAIPFGSVLPPLDIPGLPDPVPFLVAPGLDVGVLWVFALSSIAVYGVLLGGWASNNKYGFLGGLRSSAQLVAYEIPLGLGLLGVVLSAGSLQLDVIMNQQAESGIWYAFAQPLGFVVFLIASFAEAARLPFDLPEAEQENSSVAITPSTPASNCCSFLVSRVPPHGHRCLFDRDHVPRGLASLGCHRQFPRGDLDRRPAAIRHSVSQDLRGHSVSSWWSGGVGPAFGLTN